MKQRYLYMMCGLPFAGKTTITRALESRLGIRRVSMDEINTERGVWDDEKGMPPEEWERTYEEVYRRIALFLSQGESVVDDSPNFTREQRDRRRALAAEHHARPLLIYVTTPPSEVQRRWRENRRTRQRADVRDSDFAYALEHFEPPAADEEALRYDGSLPVEEWIDAVLDEIGAEGEQATSVFTPES